MDLHLSNVALALFTLVCLSTLFVVWVIMDDRSRRR